MKKSALLLICACLLFVWGCPGAVFHSERDGRAQLYKIDDSGMIQVNISNNPYQDRYPDVSPDTSQVVFSSERAATGESGIYTMDRDGGPARTLTAGPGRRSMPRWGQNGLIAFASAAYGQNFHIRTIKSDGTGERQLTLPGTMESDDGGHDFFYAGDGIVFSRKDLATQKHDLFITKTDGTGIPGNITNTPAIDETFPAISHNGRMLACRMTSSGQDRDTIRLYDVGTWTIVRDITLPSPAGAVITGLGFTQGDDRLYVSAEAADVAAPDARRRQEIFLVKTDGTGFGRLTTNDILDAWPAAIAKKDQYVKQVPVLFVHGHANGAVPTWQETGLSGTTSFKAALEANPSLPIDAFYLELPVHGATHPENFGRSIADDATDIQAAIEGGTDSRGQPGLGILKKPEYQGGKVALVGYSQGAISSRYYLNRMGSGPLARITVSEFVALAAPNHGVGDIISCGNQDEPDRSSRQLCGGRTADLVSQLQSCSHCDPVPGLFSTNMPGDEGDETFLTALNGHPFSANCNDSPGGNLRAETPNSRPAVPDGVLYVNLYAAGNADKVVGGHSQEGDCYGRRLAKNHSPDAKNMEITGVPGGGIFEVHRNFPHHWPTICFTLKTIVNHQAPAGQTEACQGLAQPQ
jgi:hypothetical protein